MSNEATVVSVPRLRHTLRLVTAVDFEAPECRLYSSSYWFLSGDPNWIHILEGSAPATLLLDLPAGTYGALVRFESDNPDCVKTQTTARTAVNFRLEEDSILLHEAIVGESRIRLAPAREYSPPGPLWTVERPTRSPMPWEIRLRDDRGADIAWSFPAAVLSVQFHPRPNIVELSYREAQQSAWKAITRCVTGGERNWPSCFSGQYNRGDLVVEWTGRECTYSDATRLSRASGDLLCRVSDEDPCAIHCTP